MILIIEGIDRVGKTTLAKALSTKLGFPIYKHDAAQFNYDKMDNYNETDKMLQLLDLYSVLGGNIIFDRFHWSDFVYGVLQREYNLLDANTNLDRIDSALSELDALIVYITPTDLSMSSSKHGLDLSSHDKMMNNCSVLSRTKVIKCNYNSIDEIIKEVSNEVNSRI